MLMNQSGEMYGLEMVTASGGRLKLGSVYVTLGRMESKGCIESRQESRRPNSRGLPRRLYKPTALGMRVLVEWELPVNLKYSGLTS